MENKSKNNAVVQKRIGFLLVVIFSLFHIGMATAQFNFVNRYSFTPKIDTLYATHRSGGEFIDSLDKAYYDHHPTLFNIGRAYLPFFQPMQNWGSYRHFFSDDRPIYHANYHFTALPFTGFFYSFGSGGEQVLDLRYTQNVGQNFNLSFRYHRTISDPVRTAFLMRNMETQANDLSLNLHFNKKRLNSFLSIYYGFDNNRENFGLDLNNPNINFFPIEQLPVMNTNANVRIRRLHTSLRNEYDLSRDSSQTLQFVSNVGFHNFQRRYKDSLLIPFDSWIYDSLNTLDIWEEPHLLIEHGFLFKQKNFKAYAGFHLDYFTYFNRAIRSSRLDGILQGAIEYQQDRLSIQSNLRFFLFGTPGEYNLNVKVNYHVAELWNIGVQLINERIFPEFFQLHFMGNHFAYDYSGQEIAPTVRTFVEPYIAFGKKGQIQLSTAYLNVNNLYTFQGAGWSFDGIQNIIAPALSFKLRKGVLGWNNKAQYFAGAKSDLFAPDYLVSSRLFLDGALFKAKKLKVATGIEVHYFDGYETMAYHPEIGVFGPLLGAESLPQQNLLLNFFINLQMDRFRFFIAANRINTLFEERVGSIVEGYPMRPIFIRMGIVWDFVN